MFPSQASNIKFEQRKKYRWASQPWIPTGEQSGFLTRTAMMGNGLSFVATKS
jgi:hypothetical protein